jgi:hypothetical protein
MDGLPHSIHQGDANGRVIEHGPPPILTRTYGLFRLLALQLSRRTRREDAERGYTEFRVLQRTPAQHHHQPDDAPLRVA